MADFFKEFDASFDSGDSNNLVEDVQQDQAAATVMASLEDEIDEEMSEAEKRLSMAAYYKAIVKNGVIEEDDGTEQAAEVNAQARVWARTQMSKLLGIYREPVAVPVVTQFSEREAFALRKLAEKAIGMGMVDKDAPAPEPTVRKVQQQPTPTIRKVAAQVQHKPTTTVKPKPQASEPVTASAVPGKAKQKPKKAPVKADGAIDYDKIPSDVVFTDHDGMPAKFRDNPNYDPDKPGSKARGKIKVSNQVRGQGMIPMPSQQAQQQISATQSMASIDMGASASATSGFGADVHATPNLFVAAAATGLANQ